MLHTQADHSCRPVCSCEILNVLYRPSLYYYVLLLLLGWLGSRVVSVLGSDAEGPGFKSQLSSNSLRETVHTHCASVHQAAKLVAAVLRVARVTVGLAESNGSLPSGL